MQATTRTHELILGYPELRAELDDTTILTVPLDSPMGAAKIILREPEYDIRNSPEDEVAQRDETRSDSRVSRTKQFRSEPGIDDENEMRRYYHHLHQRQA